MNNTKQYLKEKQHIVFQVLKNSFSKDKTSHAYIINGSKGSPILETAIFMAQSLVCQNTDEFNLACEECVNCLKIKNNGYADFKIFTGEQLKTDVTLSIQEEFNKSAIESENVKIYIIHQIEKAPIASLNKLLKFIEEPTSNIVAIFTSNSVSSILPTIVSRCQVISLKEFMIKDLVEYLINNGVNESDAWLISKISNNAEQNLNVVKSEQFSIVKEVLESSLNNLSRNTDYFIVDFQINGLKNLADNKDVELYLDMLEACLMEAIICKEDDSYVPHFYKSQVIIISKIFKHIDHMISDITNAKIELHSNANKNLVFDKLLINLLRR